MTEKQRNILRQIQSIIANDSLRPVKLITVLLGIFAGFGLSMHPDEHEIHFLLSIMPVFMWTGLYLFQSLTRCVRMFTRVTNKIFIYTESAFGVWLWVMIFSSCMFAGEYGMNFLYIVPILMETWILGRSIYDHDMSEAMNRRRRKTDLKAPA